MRPLVISVLILLCVSCGRTKGPQPDDATRQYLRLAVALGERDRNSLDYYSGPEEWVAEVRAKPPRLEQIKRDALDLVAKLEGAPAPSSQHDLIPQVRAIAARADLLQGVRVPFDEEARVFFGVSTPPSNRERIAEVRAELEGLLPGRGTLARRLAGFEQTFTVPAEKLPAVFERAMQACRERTLQHMRLPAGEGIKIEYVSDKPWNAYSYYQGNSRSLIRVNTDFGLTVDRALQLACHEGYPGHHAFNTAVDAQLVRQERRFAFLVQPTFSPQSFLSESLATFAADLVFSADQQLAFERDTLFPLAGISAERIGSYLQVNRLIAELEEAEPDIAREYLDGRLEYSRAAVALEEQLLMAQTEASLKYINEFRTYMITYTAGKQLVRRCFGTKSSEDRWRLFEQLMTRHLTLRECVT